MKVGDLVTLSAYGKRVERCSWIVRGDVGLIKAIRNIGGYRSFSVDWMRSKPNKWWHSSGIYGRLDRRDLKYVSKA